MIKVAIFDSGYDKISNWPNAVANKMSIPKLCPDGHESYTPKWLFTPINKLPNKISEVIDTNTLDNHGHGTHIAGLIAKGNDDIDYCLVIIKIFEPALKKFVDNDVSKKAFEKALEMNIDIINFSGGGEYKIDEECEIIKKLLDKGVRIIAAAGNENKDLKKTPYYPAMCDDRVIKVVNYEGNSKQATSNYNADGTIPNVVRENGINQLSFLPDNTYGLMTGTSQACAIVTQKAIRDLDQKFKQVRLPSDIRSSKKTN